jgi:hypothetical protein
MKSKNPELVVLTNTDICASRNISGDLTWHLVDFAFYSKSAGKESEEGANGTE